MEERSEFSLWLDAEFPGLKFVSQDKKEGGRVYKQRGPSAAKEYLSGKGQLEAYDLTPPAHCPIVAVSRPFEEWPVVKASAAIQRHIYAMTQVVREATELLKYDKETRGVWFKESGVPTFGYEYAQGLNLILKHAYRRYDGEVKKVENRNERARKRLERVNARLQEEGKPEETFQQEAAYKPDGTLATEIGANLAIYAYQGCAKAVRTLEGLSHPPEYQGYSRDPESLIPRGLVPKNRLAIPIGKPGYIRITHQRDNLTTKKHRRMRKAWSSPEEKALAGLLIKVQIAEDYVICDGRGLLRQAQYRGLVPQSGMSLAGLLALVSGDPVIHPDKKSVAFAFLPKVIKVKQKKTVRGRKTKEVLEKLTSTESVGVVSVDLGQTNPLSAAIYRIGQRNGSLERSEALDRFFLEDNHLKDVERYRKAHDDLQRQIEEEAIQSLTADQQLEVRKWQNISDVIAREALCADLDLDSNSLNWEAMSTISTQISSKLVEMGHVDQAYLIARPNRDIPAKKKGAKKDPAPLLKRDARWAQDYRPKLSKETRTALESSKWDLMRKSSKFQKLSKWKSELTRAITNQLLVRTEKRTQCSKVVFIIEDLQSLQQMFSGKGKRLPGWTNFFQRKAENRWFVMALHKALSDKAINAGMYVLEVAPHNTSRTCPVCRHCSGENRQGERFRCVACGVTLHADLEVATHNLVEVALSGTTLPSERRSASQNPGPARKRNPQDSTAGSST